MSCFKCGKQTNRKIGRTDGVPVNQCGKCSLLCVTINCNKKIFKNGYCSLHTVIVNDKAIFFKGRNVSEEDVKRREKMLEVEENFEREITQKRMIIDLQKQKMASYDIENGNDIISRLDKSIEDKIELRNQRLDKLLLEVKETTVQNFNDKLQEMFKTGVYPVGYKSDYQEYKGRFSQYRNDYKNHKHKRRRQEERKSERTRKRNEEREENNGRTYDQYYNSYSHKDDDSDVEDEETFFERTAGPSMMKEAFKTLEIDYVNDYDLVRKAYKKMALKYHPDKHVNELELYNMKFLDVMSAYELIVERMFPELSK